MVEPTPDFERFRTALACREPDRVPLAELKMDDGIKSAFLGRAVETLEDEVDFWHTAGYDYVRLRPEYRFHQGGFRAHKGEYTLYGDGTEEKRWADEGQSLITTRNDFEAFPWPGPDDADYSKLEAVGDLLPEGMRVVSGVTGVFEGVWMLMGFEGFAYALREDPALVGQMFDRTGSILMGIFENAIAYDCVGAMWLSDDIAYTESLLISPTLLRDHVFPWYKRMGDLCAANDKPFLFHSDGDLRPVLGDIISSGINAIHPIEPKAMDIRELKAELGRKLCLIGNLDLGGVLTRGTPDEVVEATKSLIRDVGPGGGYCVGSSNTVTNYVPLENYRAMIDTTLEYGQYPITS